MRSIFITLILLLPAAVQAKDALRLGFTDYPPFISSDSSSQPQGKVIDFIERHLRRDFDITWIRLPITRSKWAFENDGIDAYPFLTRNREREAYAHFPSKPYMTVQPLLCSLPQAAMPADKLVDLDEALERTTIVHPEGAHNAFDFLKRSTRGKIRLPYNNYNSRSIRMLETRRANYAIFVTSFGIQGVIDEGRILCRQIGDARAIFFAFDKHNSSIPKVESILKPLDLLRF